VRSSTVPSAPWSVSSRTGRQPERSSSSPSTAGAEPSLSASSSQLAFCDKKYAHLDTKPGDLDPDAPWPDLPDEPDSDTSATAALERQKKVDDLQTAIDWIGYGLSTGDNIIALALSAGDKVGTYASDLADAATVDVLKAVAKGVAAVTKAVINYLAFGLEMAQVAAHMAGEATSTALKQVIRDTLRGYKVLPYKGQCSMLMFETHYTVAELELETRLLAIDALDALWAVEGILTDIALLENERLRLQDEWEDTERLAVHVAAARDDPNVRVFRTDAIINADASFRRAVRSAYRATKVFEYYTSQTYAALDKLFLVRMVRAGEQNLQRYLGELDDAFFEFQEESGQPETRLLVLSLRDDMLDVPRFDETEGMRVLAHAERVQRLRELLTSAAYRDERGRISVPFSVELDQLSPLTYDHKVLAVELEVLGDAVGDDVGRVYVEQAGSALVRSPDGERLPYAFPVRSAVVDVTFNGQAPFDPATGHVGGPNSSVYRSYRLRDRPVVNSTWRLVFDVGPGAEEVANQDIRVGALDDLVLRVFYTDFTSGP